MLIVKFGGTSLADADRLAHAARLAAGHAARETTWVVVSAQAGVTDRLVAGCEAARSGKLSVEGIRGELGSRHLSTLEALRRLTPALAADDVRQVADQLHRRLLALAADLRELAELGRRGSLQRQVELQARILATGERLSAPLAAAALRGLGLDAETIDAAEVVALRGPLLDADPDLDTTAARLRERLDALPAPALPVFPGFLGVDPAGRLGLLGRGGSDTTATLLAAAGGADRVDIYSDVDGILDADPRKNPKARLLPFLTYGQAFELAARGAKVLHPKAVEPARRAGIPIVVRNTFRPEHPGTRVAAAPSLEPEVAVA